MMQHFKLSILSLVFFFFFAACSPKIDKQTAPENNLPLGANDKIEKLENFEPRLQNPRILIWPLIIDSTNKNLISTVISSARSINELQISYFQTKDELQKSYHLNSCECALYDTCSEEDNKSGPAETELCESIENQISANENKIPKISTALDSMKQSLLQAHGSWLEPEKAQEQLFSFKIDALQFRTGQWLISDHNSQNIYPAFQGFDIFFEIKNLSRFFSIRLQNAHGHDIGKAKLEVSSRNSYLHFQGDIELQIEDKMRKGLIIFQQNRKLTELY